MAGPLSRIGSVHRQELEIYAHVGLHIKSRRIKLLRLQAILVSMT